MSFDTTLYPTLALIHTPDDLRLLSKELLPKICIELRQYLLDSVSQSGGHFASGLGTIELTIALHYVYNTPFDHLIWDVGHQAYPHKILTGRREKMKTIRQRGGLHPFPWREESEYDILSVGHSSTSISAGLGLAIAAQRENSGKHTVCVIGDGAITAGMAFEAMNHAGVLESDLLVVLNDNEMSISENVGALNKHLVQLLSGKLYSTLREGGKKVLSNLPPIKELVKKTEEHLKGMVIPGTLFEELGFNYIGPIDGHDILALVQTLKNMRQLKGPQLLHVVTKKGKGYSPAEQDPIAFHAVAPFDLSNTAIPSAKNKPLTYSQIFGNWLCETAAQDKKLMGITPAMREGSGMVKFSQDYPTQYFDVAIAEQHAVTFAAGLAIGGFKPVVAIYSTFLQRAYDQLIHDIAIQNLPVLFAIDRGGIVGADGQTHQGAFDLAFLRCIPNMIIMTPSDEDECLQMLHTGYHHQKGPVAVRYPRGTGPGAPLASLKSLVIGKGKLCCSGTAIAFLNFGALLHEVIPAAKALNATVADMRFVKPLDQELILELAKKHEILVTVEEGCIMGGAGSAVNELLLANQQKVKVLNLGLPDHFIPPSTQQQAYYDLKLDSDGILEQVTNWINQQ